MQEFLKISIEQDSKRKIVKMYIKKLIIDKYLLEVICYARRYCKIFVRVYYK